MSTELKAAAEALKSDFEKFKEAHERELAEVKKQGTASAETKQELERLQDRLDAIEAEAKRARIAQAERQADDASAEEREQKAAFWKYARKGERGVSEAELKALSTDSDPDGGYAAPPTVSRNVIQKLIEMSDLRGLATVETISGSAWEEPAEGSQDFTSGWTAERGSRSETQTGQIRMIRIPVHEQYAAPRISQTMLDDASFAIEAWLSSRVATRLSVKEGTAFVSGNGVTQPQGINDSTLVTGVTCGSAGAITADGLMDVAYDLPEPYFRNATWLLKRVAIRNIRKLKTPGGDQQYIWQPGIAGSQPATILDRPYREMIDMPTPAAATSPIVFGDIRAGYKIVDRMGIRVLRDPYSAKPFVEFYTTKRVGGGIVLAEALRRGTLA